MKQQPIRVKYKKAHKKKNFKGLKAKKLILYGTGISIKKQKYHSYNQFEAARKIIARKLKPKEVKNKKNLKNIRSAMKKKKRRRRKIKRKFLLLRPSFIAPLTKKPLQVRMGKGKGAPYTYIFPACRSRIVLEMSRKYFSLQKISSILRKSCKKLPTKTKMITTKRFLRKEHFSKRGYTLSFRKVNNDDGIYNFYKIQRNFHEKTVRT